MTRDATELLVEGIGDEDRNKINQKLTTFEAIPTAEEFDGMLSDATDVKDKVADALRSVIRTVMIHVSDAFGEHSGKYRGFRTAGLSKQTDDELLRTCKTVIRQIGLNKTALMAKKLSQETIDEIDHLRSHFETSLGAQDDAESAGIVATEERAIAANDLYDDLVRICDYGKNIWVEKSPAKYEDYVIYDTPSGKKDDDTPPENPA